MLSVAGFLVYTQTVFSKQLASQTTIFLLIWKNKHKYMSDLEDMCDLTCLNEAKFVP